MSLLFTFILRTVFNKRVRTGIVLLSLALMASMLILNLNAKSVAMRSYEVAIRNSFGKIDIIVTKNNENRRGLFKLSDFDLLDNGADHKIMVLEALGICNPDGKKNIQIHMVGAYLEDLESADLIRVEESTTSSEFLKNQIIISKMQAELYGISIGDNIDVLVQGSHVQLNVAALSESYGMFYDERNTFRCVIPMEEMNSIIGINDLCNALYLGIPDHADIGSVVTELRKENDSFNISEAYDISALNMVLGSMNMLLIVALVLVGYLSTVVILSIYKHILDERIPVMGTFKSVGVSNRRTSLILLLENAVYGFLGSVAGVTLGLFASRLFYNIFFDNFLSIDLSETSVQFSTIILTIIFITAWAVLISLFSIIRLNKLSLKEIIFQTSQTANKLNKQQLIIGIVLLFAGLAAIYFRVLSYSLIFTGSATLCASIGFILMVRGFLHGYGCLFGKLAGLINNKLVFPFKSVAYNKTVAKNICILSIALGLTVSIFAIMDSVGGLFNYAMDTFDFDVIIGIDMRDEKDYTAIFDFSSVEEHLVFFHAPAAIKYQDQNTNVLIVARAPNDHFDSFVPNAINLYEYDVASMLAHDIILDRHMMEKLGISLGDTVGLGYKNTYHELKVVADMESLRFNGSGNTAIVTLDYFIQNISSLPGTIYIQSTGDVEKTANDIQGYLLDTTYLVKTKSEFFGVQRATSDSLMQIVQFALLLGALVGLLGIINSFIVNYISRKKEFAILISTSSSKKQLTRLLAFEIVSMLFAVILLSILFSLVLVYSFGQVLATADMLLPISYPWASAFVVMLLGAIVLIMMIIVPARIVAKLDVFNVLRAE